MASSAERAAFIQIALQWLEPTELDLWLPGAVVEQLRVFDLDHAALALESWIQWAEAAGRKDILMFAAANGIDILNSERGAAAVVSLAAQWAALPNSPETERSRVILECSIADLYFGLGDNQRALQAYRKARALAQSLDDLGGQGETLRGEASILALLGDHQQALELYQTARTLFEASGNRLGQGSALRGAADVLFRRGDDEQALQAYRKSRDLSASINDRLGQGNSWNGEAEIFFRRGDNGQALDGYRKARAFFADAGDRLGQGNSWNGEAEILLRRGDNEQALHAYRTAQAFFSAIGNLLGQGNAWHGEALVLKMLGEPEQALQALREARALFLTAGDQLGQGNTWVAEADVLIGRGDISQSLNAYRTARDFFVTLDDEIGLGNTWLGEARVHFVRNDFQKALQGYRKARTLFTDPFSQGLAFIGEAFCLLQNREWQGAVEAAVSAIKGFRTTEDIPGQLAAFLVKAMAEDKFGDAIAAARSATEAIHLHARWRKVWITDHHRTEWEWTISHAYKILVPIRAKQEGQVAEALRLAEKARSRVLLDLLATPPDRGESVPAVNLMAQRQRLEAELWQIEEQLRSLKGNRQDEFLIKRRQLDQELEWNHYQRLATQEESFLEAPPLDAAGIQALARDTGPLLLYYAAEDEVWGFLLQPGTDEIFLQPIAVTWEELDREVRGLAHALANPLYEARAEGKARELWDLLIAPFSDRIPMGGPLVLVPNGPLHELPFEALLDPTKKPLFERWQISVTPSASALDHARRRHAASSPNDSFLAFSSGQGLNLPVIEVAEISGFFGANKATFRPIEARYQNYEKLVTQARHLLIATRGVHNEGRRTETYLEIQPTPEVHDSRLTSAEIATIPLNAELVTLAACDTSHGRALLSDERLDLTRAFLIARAAAVLATRWKVPEDATTSRFLTDFYRAYRRGGPQGTGMRKDEALTEVRRRSRERGDPAQVWAAWVLVGDAR